MVSNVLKSSSSELSVSAIEIIVIFGAFVLSTILILFLKKIYYHVVLKKRYYIFPKMSVKGITNVAMVISISIAAIILLTFLTAGFMSVIFRAYPGWRVTIEGVLIKIGGLLFGPIIGLFIGGFTDVLTVGMTAGMFHYGYFIVAMAYGFVAGIIRTVLNISKDKEMLFLFLITIVTIVIYASILFFLYTMNTEPSIEFLGVRIHITKVILITVFSCISIGTLVVMWGCALAFDFWKIVYNLQQFFILIRFSLPIKKLNRKLKRSNDIESIANKQLNWMAKHERQMNDAERSLNKVKKRINFNKIKIWFNYVSPVLITTFICESVVEILIMPVFDIDFSALSYSYWLTFRFLMLMFMYPMNVLIIFPIYRIVRPSMKYNYLSDLSESIYTPLMVN